MRAPFANAVVENSRMKRVRRRRGIDVNVD
jgi:hypothetical protein